MGKKSREKKQLKVTSHQEVLPKNRLVKDIAQQPVLVQGIALLVFIGLCVLLFYPPYMRAMFFTREQLPTHLLTYALFILWWAVKYLRRDGSFFREPLDYLVFAFVLAYLLSFTVAINVRGAIQEFLKVGNYFLVYWLVSELGRTRKEASLVLLNVLVLSAVGVAVLGLGAAAGTWEVAGGYLDGRIFSTIQYPNSLAAYLTGAFLVSLALWQTAPWKLRQFYAVAAFLLLVTAILTYSRGGWLVMPVFVLLYIVFTPRSRRLDALLFVGIAAAVAVGLTASPGRAAAEAGELWLWIFAGCLAVLAGQYLLIDIRKRIKLVFLLGTFALLALLLVGTIGAYVYRTLAAPLLLAQSGVEQLIAVRPGTQYNLTMEVLATTEEGEAPFAWQLTVLEQRKDNTTTALLQETGRQTQGWEKRSFTFTASAEARRALVSLQSVHPGTSVEARNVTLTGVGSSRRLNFAWNRLLPGLLYSRLFGLDREVNVQGRFDFFRDAWEIIKDHPWRGLGGHAWSSIYFQYQSSPYSTTEVHNHFLQVWIETGLIGFLIFVGIWLLFIFTSYRLYRGATQEQKVLITGIATGVLAVAAHSAYDFNLSLSAIGLFVFALMGVIHSFVPEQRVVSAHWAVYKPVVAIFVTLGLAIFVIRLMVANGAMEEGISWMRRGQLNRGVQAFEQAVRHDPFDPQMRLMLAEAYENKGMQTENPGYFEKAREQYTAALNNNRYNPRFSHSLGAFLVRSGQFDQGLAYLQETIRLHPRFAEHLRIYANTVLNVAQFSLRENDQVAARSYLERVFAADRQVQERFGDQFLLAFAVGGAHFMMGNAEQASVYLERASISGEDKPHALMVLSLIYERKGDSMRARELHGQALGIDPASESTYQAFKNL